MPPLKTYRIFISHAWHRNDDYNRLTKMLNEAKNFSWMNYSVPDHDPLDTRTDAQLVEALKDQIRPVHVVLILAGMYVPHSKWIQREIDIAKGMGKPIVGIRPWGNQIVPRAVQDAAVEVVGWNTDSIVGAIRRNVL